LIDHTFGDCGLLEREQNSEGHEHDRDPSGSPL
jgi:hypothetical protein